MQTRTLTIFVSLLALAVVATGAFAVLQTQRLTEERDRVAELDSQVAGLRTELAELEEQLASARRENRGAGNADADEDSNADGDERGLGGMDVGRMLDDLLGGSIPGQECMTPDIAGLDGLLDGLFGGGRSLPDDPDELVEVVADQVAEIRELTWQEPVSAEFLSTPELHERLEALLDEEFDPDELDASQRLLTALGAIPPGTDLEGLQRDLLDDQVAGYYVPETGELVVRVPDDGQLRPADKVTLAHELDHALADQVLGLPDFDEPPFGDDADAALALLSVIEGDATLLMNLWALSELSMSDQLAMAMDPSIAAAQAALDDVPSYVQNELLFPYTSGLDWACQAYLAGGWAAVDAGYDDPPQTSAEVLWGEPVQPGATSTMTAPDGFAEVMSTTFGAAPLLWLLEAPGDDRGQALDDPDGRARAWGGGEVTVWARGDDTAVGLAFVDSGAGTAPLCSTIEDWYGAAFPDAVSSTSDGVTSFEGEAAAALACDGDDVVIAIAPDRVSAQRIAGV